MQMEEEDYLFNIDYSYVFQRDSFIPVECRVILSKHIQRYIIEIILSHNTMMYYLNRPDESNRYQLNIPGDSQLTRDRLNLALVSKSYFLICQEYFNKNFIITCFDQTIKTQGNNHNIYNHINTKYSLFTKVHHLKAKSVNFDKYSALYKSSLFPTSYRSLKILSLNINTIQDIEPILRLDQTLYSIQVDCGRTGDNTDNIWSIEELNLSVHIHVISLDKIFEKFRPILTKMESLHLTLNNASYNSIQDHNMKFLKQFSIKRFSILLFTNSYIDTKPILNNLNPSILESLSVCSTKMINSRPDSYDIYQLNSNYCDFNYDFQQLKSFTSLKRICFNSISVETYNQLYDYIHQQRNQIIKLDTKLLFTARLLPILANQENIQSFEILFKREEYQQVNQLSTTSNDNNPIVPITLHNQVRNLILKIDTVSNIQILDINQLDNLKSLAILNNNEPMIEQCQRYILRSKSLERLWITLNISCSQIKIKQLLDTLLDCKDTTKLELLSIDYIIKIDNVHFIKHFLDNVKSILNFICLMENSHMMGTFEIIEDLLVEYKVVRDINKRILISRYV